MYHPIQDGVERGIEGLRYTVQAPPAHLSRLVHHYWEMRTEAPLTCDFLLLAMPDACVNLLFNQVQPEVAGVTALRTSHEVLNLGRAFHYVGVELMPGTWRGDPRDLCDRYVGTPYTGALPLVVASRRMAAQSFDGKQRVMTELVQALIDAGLLARNLVVERILAHLTGIRSVADMAAAACLSQRQLQRSIRQSTGFAPHDLLKVLRVQQSFRRSYLDLFADQSHYIHAFRRVTGHTPARYREKFDVRFIQDAPPNNS